MLKFIKLLIRHTCLGYCHFMYFMYTNDIKPFKAWRIYLATSNNLDLWGDTNV